MISNQRKCLAPDRGNVTDPTWIPTFRSSTSSVVASNGERNGCWRCAKLTPRPGTYPSPIVQKFLFLVNSTDIIFDPPSMECKCFNGILHNSSNLNVGENLCVVENVRYISEKRKIVVTNKKLKDATILSDSSDFGFARKIISIRF